jgi:GxxExxY protein
VRSIHELCDVVRETAYALHLYHGHGHFERIYENGLVHRLTKVGLAIRPQFPVAVRDEDGTVLGDYLADLLVENRLIVEIKACRSLLDEHTAQLLGYLKGTGIEHGLLINFGSYKFQIRKFVFSRNNSPQDNNEEHP